jgi:hypothetical protein
MNTRDYFIAGGLSIVIAVIITLLLQVLSLVGWWLVGGAIAFVLIPSVMKAVQFYHDTNCTDLSDFCIEVDELVKDKNKNNNKIGW